MKASDNVFPKLLFAEGASPATPAAGSVIAYAKADGLLYSKDDAGTETQLGGGGGSGDFSGPASSVDGHLVVFDGVTGKLGKDGGAPFANPMTTGGDIIYGGSGGTPARLAAGTDGYVLTMVSGAPSWAAASGGGGGTDRSTVTALSISSGVVNIDCSLGDYFTLSLTANVTTITFSNLPAAGKGASIAVQIRQDGTGSRTVSLPSSSKATGGSDTSVQPAANAYTLLTLTTFDQGTRWAYAMQEVAP